LEKYGINITEYQSVRDLKFLGDWITTSVIINTDELNENYLIDYVNGGNSVVIILNEDFENAINFVEELGVNVSQKFNKEDEYSYVSPTDDLKIKRIKTDGFLFSISEKVCFILLH
jgi:hypothetical protein